MKLIPTLKVCLLAATLSLVAQNLSAQTWEAGGGGGIGFYTGHNVDRATESAQAKIKMGPAFSAWLGNNNKRYLGGELRYDYQQGDLRLKQGATEATFAAQSHAIHYDFLWHTSEVGSRVRSFVAFGGGIKVYRGTGTEALTQPLSRFALLTKTTELQGMLSLGAGIKWRLGKSAQLRVDVHDYVTRFPKEVITANTGAKVGGWIHDIVPMVGISWAK